MYDYFKLINEPKMGLSLSTESEHIKWSDYFQFYQITQFYDFIALMWMVIKISLWILINRIVILLR